MPDQRVKLYAIRLPNGGHIFMDDYGVLSTPESTLETQIQSWLWLLVDIPTQFGEQSSHRFIVEDYDSYGDGGTRWTITDIPFNANDIRGLDIHSLTYSNVEQLLNEIDDFVYGSSSYDTRITYYPENNEWVINLVDEGIVAIYQDLILQSIRIDDNQLAVYSGQLMHPQ